METTLQNKTNLLSIELDFYGDWISILRRELAAMGHPTSPNDSPQEISLRYFNLIRRMIWPTPRAVYVSKEFSCPQEHAAGVELIKHKIVSGESLAPHLSNTIRSTPDYDDLLLNDWGIHHLHLGTTLDTSGLVAKRTGPLLFVRVTDTAVYLINVFAHDAWTQKQIIEILHANWPDSIKQFSCPGISSAFSPSDSDRARFRKAGLTVLCQLADGTVYVPIGGGYMSTGLSMRVLMESDRYARWVHSFEKYVREQAPEFVRRVEAIGRKVGPVLKFQLVLDKEDHPFALETTSNVRFELMPSTITKEK